MSALSTRIGFALRLALMLLAVAATRPAQAADAAQSLFDRAEALRTEKSYRSARELYEQVLTQQPAADLALAAQVRAADTQWRENPHDGSFATPAAEQLQKLSAGAGNPRWRALAAESLAELRQETQRWNLEIVLQAYFQALKIWEPLSSDEARTHTLELRLAAAETIIETRSLYPFPNPKDFPSPITLPPPPLKESPWKGDLATWLLTQVLEMKAASAADTARHARAHYLLGLQRLRYTPYGPQQNLGDIQAAWRAEGQQHLRDAIKLATPDSRIRLDAQFTLAQLLNERARYVEAAQVLREYLATNTAGVSPQAREARELLDQITTPQLNLNAGEAFAPDSFIPLYFNGRNLSQAEIVIEQIAPEAIIKQAESDKRDQNWSQLAGKAVRRIPVELKNDGKHTPQSQTLYLDHLPPGLYRARALSSDLLQTTASQRNQLVAPFLVSRLAFTQVLHQQDALVWVADAESGAPREGAAVRLLLRYGDREQQTQWLSGKTDAHGLVTLRFPEIKATNLSADLLLIEHEDNVAIGRRGMSLFNPYYRQQADQPLLIYSYADRPAYRPGEKVQWKAILRAQSETGYTLPDLKTLRARIRDERGGLVYEASVELSDFGTLSGEFTTSASTALGVLSLELTNPQDNKYAAGAQLCRLEEYKLPEYIVNVNPAPGQRRLGDAVPVKIKAEYYFGGPVAGAEAQVVVTQTPFWAWWSPWPFPWIESDFAQPMPRGKSGRGFGGMRAPWRGYAPPEPVLSKTIQLDAQGSADFTLPAATSTSLQQAIDNQYWGYSYTVEVRVTDASRREVSGSGSIKLARTGFAAYLTPDRNVVLPGDPLRATLKTLDPNDQPLSAEGPVALERATWNNQRRNLKGDWDPGYDYQRIDQKPAGTTREAGEGTIEFKAPTEGIYRLLFTACDAFGSTVTAETMVYVSRADSAIAGLRSGGVELVADKRFYTRGETAEILITTRRPGVDVLFAVEGQSLLREDLLRMGGAASSGTSHSLNTATAKIVRVPITDQCEPQLDLSAVAMYDWSAYQSRLQLAVPPAPQYLNVNLELPKAEYQPGERTTVGVRVTDWQGKPVVGELSLGVADAAVWAIADDFVGDIRAAFWTQPARGYRRDILTCAEQYFIQRWRRTPNTTDQYEQAPRDLDVSERQDFARDEANDFKTKMANGRMIAPDRIELAASPASAAPMLTGAAKMKIGEAADKPTAPAPRLRSNFQSSALWLAHLVTGADGRGQAELTLPDSLTTWKATAIGIDKQTRVGQVRTEIKTNLPLMVRPQGPRFLVAGDVAAFSAVINNATSESQQVAASLALQGGTQLPADQLRDLLASTTAGLRVDTPRTTLPVPGLGQRRVDWLLTADQPGTLSVTLEARSPIGSDAVRKSYPILEYGAEQFLAQAATLRGSDAEITRELKIDLPEKRRADSERLTVWLEPTLARTMVNALPYLAQYPYGCMEQTLSRFVPAVITARVLHQLGLRRPELEAELPKMIAAGLERLYGAQHANGAWGWWKDGPDDPWMTAYVLAGLAEARAADVSLDEARLTRAAAWLTQQLADKTDEPDMLAYMLYALAMHDAKFADTKLKAAYERLWPQRDQLNPYTRALLTLACRYTQQTERTQILLRNMRNGLVEDKANGTAHWGTSGVYYRWSEGGIEATAFSLRALLAADPKSDLIEPVLTWLVRNRKGTRWESTRDTAIVIGALADTLLKRGEDKADWTAEVRVNGKVATTLRVTPETLWDAPEKIDLAGKLLRSGENTISITRRGTGTLYAMAGATFFNQASQIDAAGHELFITRRYFHEATKAEVRPGEVLSSGERITVRLSIEAKNHYQYIMIEDPKPAGMEPIEQQSGYVWEQQLGFQREWRDNRTALFIDRLPEGRHEISYTLRAEIPGRFSALPSQIQAMYVPELRGNGASRQILIRDAENQ
jgi:uncharacterized protein YfaS (alpha-2-macroglobulin family)